MSLKRRNYIAVVLLIMAALCWAIGGWLLEGNLFAGQLATTVPLEFRENTTMPAHVVTFVPATEYTADGGSVPTADTHSPDMSDPYLTTGRNPSRLEKYIGYILCFAAAAAAVAGVLVLRQKMPIFGPDGICALGGVAFLVFERIQNADYLLWGQVYTGLLIAGNAVKVFFVLLFARELWGWLLVRCNLRWCLSHRILSAPKRPQLAMVLCSGWIALAVLASGYLLLNRSIVYVLLPVCCFVICVVFGFLQLWHYGADLRHFQNQLERYRTGLPIAVKEGVFAETEAQLLQVQAQHEEAVRTAVTSERFKVELIANVSHDLRTPLTSILGYSELLQKETLSADGQQLLQRLHQKAGYMSDLVESLFELTKVSSGVIESKKEEIDLIRLLEQTIGLYDDQLAHAGLFVRRSYAADSVLVITDGARMHQVFANLLGNAIKYAMAGTRIYLEVKETENGILVRMMNTACYEMDFKPEEIMQRFARGDKARSTKGSGLGLAIAQTYTESVGGSFRVAVDGDQFSAIVELPKIERNL